MVAAAAVLTKATALAAHGAVLAKGSVNTNDITPGVLGFLVVAGMAVVLVFLLRSMNRQFRKLPPPEPDQADEAKAGPAGDVAATGAATGSGRRRRS
jgi:hypothetical protein